MAVVKKKQGPKASVTITDDCRLVRGDEGAIDNAFELLREELERALANKPDGYEFRIDLHIERDA